MNVLLGSFSPHFLGLLGSLKIFKLTVSCVIVNKVPIYRTLTVFEFILVEVIKEQCSCCIANICVSCWEKKCLIKAGTVSVRKPGSSETISSVTVSVKT